MDQVLGRIEVILAGLKPAPVPKVPRRPASPEPASATDASTTASSRFSGFPMDSFMVFAHATVAALTVFLLWHFNLRVPLGNLAVVALVQYLLMGRIGRRANLEARLLRPFQIVFTAIGATAFFLMPVKLPWFVGVLLDMVVAFATTALSGFGALGAARAINQFLPPWIRRRLFRDEKNDS